jgi:hypothetical protein
MEIIKKGEVKVKKSFPQGEGLFFIFGVCKIEKYAP